MYYIIHYVHILYVCHMFYIIYDIYVIYFIYIYMQPCPKPPYSAITQTYIYTPIPI